MDIEKLREADARISEVIGERTKQDLIISGGLWFNEEIKNNIKDFINDSRNAWLTKLCPKLDNGESSLHCLLSRWEEMQRRINKKSDLNLRSDPIFETYWILSIRYQVLTTLLESGNELHHQRLASSVIYNSKFAAEIFDEEEFKWLADSPSSIKSAIANYTSDPRAFLRQSKEDYDELLRSEEFSWCTPGLIKWAAISHPTDPKGHLRKIKAATDSILSDSEFSWCRPNDIQKALKSGTDAKRFLREKKVLIDEMADVPELKNFPMHSLREAAISYKDPKEFLLTLKQAIDEIQAEEEFSWAKSKTIFEVAESNPSDPRKALRKYKLVLDEITNNPEFNWATHSNLEACIRDTSNPQEVLRAMKKNIDEISQDPRFSFLSSKLIAYIVRQYPKNTKKILEDMVVKFNQLIKNDRFKRLGKTILLRAVSHHINHIEDYLENALKASAEMDSEKFLGLPKRFLSAALTRRPKNPKEALEEYAAAIAILNKQDQFNKVPKWLKEYAVLNDGLKADIGLLEKKQKIDAILSEEEFSHLPNTTIAHAVWRKPLDPRSMLRKN